MATFRNFNRPELRVRSPALPSPEPVGETPPAQGDEPAEIADRWWRESSFDLRQGLDVYEEVTIPGDLLDELTLPKRAPRRR